MDPVSVIAEAENKSKTLAYHTDSEPNAPLSRASNRCCYASLTTGVLRKYEIPGGTRNLVEAHGDNCDVESSSSISCCLGRQFHPG